MNDWNLEVIKAMKKINLSAVLVILIITFILSAVWYGTLSTQYFELRGINPHDQAATAMSGWQILIIFMRHLVLTLAMAYAYARMNVKGLFDGLKWGFVFWLGFPVVLLVGSVASDKVPFALAAIHSGDWLIKLLVIGAVLATWRKKDR